MEKTIQCKNNNNADNNNVNNDNNIKRALTVNHYQMIKWKPVSNEKFLKTKIKSKKVKSIQVFTKTECLQKVPKKIWLLAILIDSVFNPTQPGRWGHI